MKPQYTPQERAVLEFLLLSQVQPKTRWQRFLKKIQNFRERNLK